MVVRRGGDRSAHGRNHQGARDVGVAARAAGFPDCGSSAGALRKRQTGFAEDAGDGAGAAAQLAAHEVGHTLGLMHNYSASTVNRASVMDYPPPVAKLAADGSIDLSDAYATGIGEWDKVSITFGYQDFPTGMDERAAVSKILLDAYGGG